jgi:hypothetical protein
MDGSTSVVWVRYGAGVLICLGSLLVMFRAAVSMWREARKEAQCDRKQRWQSDETLPQ